MSSCDIISFIHMPFDSRFYMWCFPITWSLSILCFTKIIGVQPFPEFLVQECYRSCTFVASSIVRIQVNLVDIWKAVTYINQKSCCCRCILGYRLLKNMHMSDVSNMSSTSHHCICNVPVNAPLSKPICLALPVFSWQEFYCPICNNWCFIFFHWVDNSLSWFLLIFRPKNVTLPFIYTLNGFLYLQKIVCLKHSWKKIYSSAHMHSYLYFISNKYNTFTYFISMKSSPKLDIEWRLLSVTMCK